MAFVRYLVTRSDAQEELVVAVYKRPREVELVDALPEGGTTEVSRRQLWEEERRLDVRKQIALLGSYGFTRRGIEQLVELAVSGRLDLQSSITHTFPLAEVNNALKYLHEKIENPIRVAVTL